jgi:6-pyruvoyltetrahydropterin/6-carboxytetrahydropterin synthase
MQSFQVTKVVSFSYGHRILGHAGKCRHLHGHNGTVEIDVESDVLDRLGMVVDFGLVSEVAKRWIDENLDHRMILQRDDPAVPALQALGEPLFLTEANPTAEHLAQLVWQAAAAAGLAVREVRLWETPTSRASYRGGGWTE